jgi:hypothetical protein
MEDILRVFNATDVILLQCSSGSKCDIQTHSWATTARRTTTQLPLLGNGFVNTQQYCKCCLVAVRTQHWKYCWKWCFLWVHPEAISIDRLSWCSYLEWQRPWPSWCSYLDWQRPWPSWCSYLDWQRPWPSWCSYLNWQRPWPSWCSYLDWQRPWPSWCSYPVWRRGRIPPPWPCES